MLSLTRPKLLIICCLYLVPVIINALRITTTSSRHILKPTTTAPKKLSSSRLYSYLDDLNIFKTEKKVLIGLTTDVWNIGEKKYKDFLAVHKMAKKLQKSPYAAIEVPMWEIAQGPHYDDLQRLLESFWIPDLTSTENLLLQFDLIVVPGNSLFYIFYPI